MQDLLPVKYPKCKQKTLIISLQDKYYCLNDTCLHQSRLPSEPEALANKAAARYYKRALEDEVRECRKRENTI